MYTMDHLTCTIGTAYVSNTGYLAHEKTKAKAIIEQVYNNSI